MQRQCVLQCKRVLDRAVRKETQSEQGMEAAKHSFAHIPHIHGHKRQKERHNIHEWRCTHYSAVAKLPRKKLIARRCPWSVVSPPSMGQPATFGFAASGLIKGCSFLVSSRVSKVPGLGLRSASHHCSGASLLPACGPLHWCACDPVHCCASGDP